MALAQPRERNLGGFGNIGKADIAAVCGDKS